MSTGNVPPRLGNAHLQIVPYQAFETADKWLILAVGNDGQWQRFCTELGRADWAADPRFRENRGRVKNRESLVAEIASVLKIRPRDEWLACFEKAEIPCAPALNYAESFSLDQMTARG